MTKIAFLGTPDFVKPIKDALAKNFTLVDSLKEADLAVVAAYGKILTPKELDTPKYGAINIHPSLLPMYRGPSPIQQAILNGDKISGITIIKMDEQIDHGPIIYQTKLALSDKDNFQTLSKKMFLKAAQILPRIIKAYCAGSIKLKLQDKTQASYCPMLTKRDGYFDIHHPPMADLFDRMVRAYHPWPGTWTTWLGKTIKFHPQNKIQMEGKKIISAADFLNGYPHFPLKELITRR